MGADLGCGFLSSLSSAGSTATVDRPRNVIDFQFAGLFLDARLGMTVSGVLPVGTKTQI